MAEMSTSVQHILSKMKSRFMVNIIILILRKKIQIFFGTEINVQMLTVSFSIK